MYRKRRHAELSAPRLGAAALVVAKVLLHVTRELAVDLHAEIAARCVRRQTPHACVASLRLHVTRELAVDLHALRGRRLPTRAVAILLEAPRQSQVSEECKSVGRASVRYNPKGNVSRWACKSVGMYLEEPRLHQRASPHHHAVHTRQADALRGLVVGEHVAVANDRHARRAHRRAAGGGAGGWERSGGQGEVQRVWRRGAACARRRYLRAAARFSSTHCRMSSQSAAFE